MIGEVTTASAEHISFRLVFYSHVEVIEEVTTTSADYNSYRLVLKAR